MAINCFPLVIILCDEYYHYLHFINERSKSLSYNKIVSFFRSHSLFQKIFTGYSISDLILGIVKFCNKKDQNPYLWKFYVLVVCLPLKKTKVKVKEITFRWENLRNVFTEGSDI